MDPSYNDNDSQEEFKTNFSKLNCWLANCSELYNFLKRNITQYLMDPSTSLKEEDYRLIDVEQKAELILQKILHENFSMIINYVSKLLSKCLIQIIDSCFEEKDEDGVHLVDLFQNLRNIQKKSLLHSEICYNFFDCIIFYMNNSLVKDIMDNGICICYTLIIICLFLLFFFLKS